MQTRSPIIITITLFLLFILYLLFSNKGPERNKVTVNCSQGDSDSLSKTVQDAQAGSLIEIGSDCADIDGVIVTKDNIIIDGQGNTLTAVNEGQPVIKVVSGAKNVVIMNLEIEGGHHGIHIDEWSSALLKEISVLRGTGAGILIGKELPCDIPVEDDKTASDKLQGYQLIEKLLPDIEVGFFREAQAQMHPNYPEYCVNPLLTTLDIPGGTVILCSGIIHDKEYGIAIIDAGSAANLSVIGHYEGSPLSGLNLEDNTYAGIAALAGSSVYFYSGPISFARNGDTLYVPYNIEHGDMYIYPGATVACTQELLDEQPVFGDVTPDGNNGTEGGYVCSF